MVIGVLLGVYAGYWGGAADQVMMRAVDLLLVGDAFQDLADPRLRF